MFEISLLQINPIAFRLFGWPVHWYGLIIGIGIAIAYWMIHQEAKRQYLNEEKVSDIVFWTIIIGFVGARLYYVLFRLDFYLANPSHIFRIWEGGIAIYGGILAGILTIYYLCRRYQVPFVSMLDISGPAVLTAQAIGRWGNFINQEAYGYEVSRQFLERLMLPDWLINQMQINGNYHHPTFLYESVWNVLGVVILLWMRRRPKYLKSGEIAARYLLWYGLGRMVIEGMRTDSLYFGPLRVSQWVAVIFVILSSIYIFKVRKDSTKPYYELES